MNRWHHANAARSAKRMIRRALYLRAIQCGERPGSARTRLGMSERTARRYEAEAR